MSLPSNNVYDIVKSVYGLKDHLFEKETRVVAGVDRKVTFNILETSSIHISKLGMNSKNTFVRRKFAKEGEINDEENGFVSSFYIVNDNTIKYVLLVSCFVEENKSVSRAVLKEELEGFIEVVSSLFRLALSHAEVEPIPSILNFHYATERKPTISKNRVRQIK